MDTKEIYVSVDIEVDGPIPGPHSMLSLGAAAFSDTGVLLSTFSANLVTLPNASGHPHNMSWWSKHPEAWEVSRQDPQDPKLVMKNFTVWLNGLSGKPIFVGYPVAFDFMFVYWYLMHFIGESPFSHSGIDIRTYAMALLRQPYHKSGKYHMPDRWLEEEALSHVAVDDAIKQGKMFCKMLLENGL